MQARTSLVLAAVLVCCLLVARESLAEDGTKLSWSVIAGGGGTSAAGGGLGLNDTLGEPVIGPTGSDAVSLEAGYWPGVRAGPAHEVYLPLILKND